MLLTFDVSFIELWEHLCHAGYWLVPILGVWLLVYGLNAMAWLETIKGNYPDAIAQYALSIDAESVNSKSAARKSVNSISAARKSVNSKSTARKSVNRKSVNRKFFWRIYRLTITGYALNYATPVGGLGGEPYRIMELSRHIDKEHATSSVILYAMMHFLAHFWFWFASIFIYLALAAVGDMPLTPAIAAILSVIVVFCLAAFYLFSKGYRNGLVKYVLGIVVRLPGLRRWTLRFWARHSESIEQIDRQIASLHSQDKGAFYRSLAYEFLSRVVQSSEVLFMLLLFGIDNGGGVAGISLTYLHSILIVAFTTLFANLIGFLPMQLGVQEGGFVLSIAALGLSAALGIFVSIICRVREIFWIAVGMLLMKMR